MNQTERDAAIERIDRGVAETLGIVSRLVVVEESAKSAHHRLDDMDSVGLARCDERRVACEAQRTGASTVTVAQIQAAASIKGRWLAFWGTVLVGVGAAVAAIVSWFSRG